MASDKNNGTGSAESGDAGAAGFDASGFVDPALAARIAAGGTGTGNSGDGNAPAGEYGFRKDGQPARKRGRKPGSGSGGSSGSGRRNSRSQDSVSVNGLEKILLSIHGMGAMLLSTPELAIDDSEARVLAEAVNAVQQHYQIEASETAIIWANFIGAIIAVYGPRAIAIATKEKKPKKDKPQKQQSGQVIDFPGMPAPTDNFLGDTPDGF